MNPIIEKYKDVRPINDDKAVIEIAEEMLALPDTELVNHFAGTQYSGAIFLYESPKHPGKVLELVMGQIGDDHISALYEPHPLMGERQRWIEARTELIEAVEKIFSAPKGLCAIMDPSRGRHVLLSEFVTAQLLDIVQDSERRIALPH